ncbi:MAG TPA: toll/interleukin-1 receptor domain-containing protein [Candidatus Angelobacter sp.]|nr:toll/interleukin-1 receptor domain-containing protein [Candidatus Angelobacter sp.]
MPESELQIFISHSSKDDKIARALIDLLRAALSLGADSIRCSSVDGYRLPVGMKVESRLRQEVHDAKIVIGIITQDSLGSDFVKFELGARWGTDKFLALLLAGINSELSAPLNILNTLSANSEPQLQQLLDDVAAQLGSSLQKAASYAHLISAVKQEADNMAQTNLQQLDADSTSSATKNNSRILSRPVVLAIIIIIVVISMAAGYLIHPKQDRADTRSEPTPAPTPIRSPSEQSLLVFNDRIWELRKDYQNLQSNPDKAPEVNSRADQLASQISKLDDKDLNVSMQILKYEHLSYAWGMTAGSEPDNTSRRKAADESLKASAMAKKIVSRVNRANASDKTIQAAKNWILKDDAEARINRLTAAGLCLRSQATQNKDDARRARTIVENLPDHYLVKEKPENSSELQPCVSNTSNQF